MMLYVLLNDYLSARRDPTQGTIHSFATSKTYRANLRHFLCWLEERIGEPPTLQSWDAPTFHEYVHYLQTKTTKSGRDGNRPRTVNNHICALRDWEKWLVQKQFLRLAPTSALKRPKMDEAQRDLITEEEVKKLLEASEVVTPESKRLLYRAVLHVFVCCGLRKTELTRLKVQDVQFDNATRLNPPRIVVEHGKGDKRRICYMPPDCQETMKGWLKQREALKPKTDALFVCATNRGIGEESLVNMMDTLATIARLPDPNRVTPHVLRYAFAAHLYKESGENLKLVSDALGHSMLKQTEHYLRGVTAERGSKAHFQGWRRKEEAEEPKPLPEAPKRENPRSVSDTERGHGETHRRKVILRRRA